MFDLVFILVSIGLIRLSVLIGSAYGMRYGFIAGGISWLVIWALAREAAHQAGMVWAGGMWSYP
jgi:hypothetical protein